MDLLTNPRFANADDFYEALIETHRDLSVAASHALNARLVLLLANHNGAIEVLRQALAAARAGASAEPQETAGTPDRHYPAPHHAR